MRGKWDKKKKMEKIKRTIRSILLMLQVIFLTTCQSSEKDTGYVIYTDDEGIKELIDHNKKSLEYYPEEINQVILKYIEKIKHKKYEIKEIKVNYKASSVLEEGGSSTFYVDSSKYKVYSTLKPLNESGNLYYYFLIDQNFNIIDTMANFNGDGQHPVDR